MALLLLLLAVFATGADAAAPEDPGLVITFSGLPSALSPDATLTGPGGFSRAISVPQTIVGLAAGEYTLTSRTVPTVPTSQKYNPIPATKVVVLDPGTTATLDVAYRPVGYPMSAFWFNVAGHDCPWRFVNAKEQWQRGDRVCGRVVLQVRSASACDWTTLVVDIGHTEAAAPGANPKPPFVRNAFLVNTAIENLRLPPEPIQWRFYPAAPANSETSQPPFGAACGLDTPDGGRYWYPVSGGAGAGSLNTPVNPGPMGTGIQTSISGELRFRRF
jgi:hypothetical protein